MEIPYPKLKYQGVEVKPGQPVSENPGYVYAKVANPDEEKALQDSRQGAWFDTPGEAIAAFKGAKQEPALMATAPAGGDAQVEGAAKQTGEWPRERDKKGGK